MRLLTAISLWLALSAPTFAKQELLPVWAIELNKGKTVLDRFQEYRMGGVEMFGKTFVIASPNGTLELRDLRSGGILWQTKLQGPSQCEWTFDQGVLFGGDSKGRIYALDASSGKILWDTTTKGVIYSKPLVVKDTVFVMNSLATVQAYDRGTGNFKWQQSDPSVTTTALWSRSGIATLDGQLIAGYPSALLQGMSLSDGQVLWKESFSEGPAGADSINDLKALSANDPYLVASSFGGDLKVWTLKAGARKLIWQKKISLHVASRIAGETLLVSAKDGSIQSLEISNGYLRWKREIPKGLATEMTVDAQNRIWVASSAGQVFVYSAEGDLLASTTSVESPIWNPPLVASENDVVFLSSQAILRRVRLVMTGATSSAN